MRNKNIGNDGLDFLFFILEFGCLKNEKYGENCSFSVADQALLLYTILQARRIYFHHV